MANLKPVCRWTPEQAKAASVLAVKARAERKAYLQAHPEERNGHAKQLPVLSQSDPVAKRFMDAIKLTLDEYLEAEKVDAKGRAALARAIRDLRETWHSITGQPRPGLAKGPVRPQRSPGTIPSPDNPA